MTDSKSPKQKSGLGAVFLTVFIDLAGFSIIFPLYPAMLDFYFEREGANGLLGQLIHFLQGFAGSGDNSLFITTVLFGGILGSLFSFLQFMSAPVWGGISDRIGRRRVLLWTVSGNLLGYVLWAFSGSFLLLLISRVINGLMSGNLSVATAAAADLTSREKRAGGMAVIGVAFGLGFIIGPALGAAGMLLDLSPAAAQSASFALNPFSMPALIAAALALFNLLWIWRCFPTTRPATPEQRAGVGPLKKFAALPVGPTRKASLVNFLFVMAFSGMEFSITFLALERLNYTPIDNGKLFFFIGIVLMLVQGGIVRRMAPRVGEKRMALAGFLIGAVGLVLLGLTESTGMLYLGAGLMSVCIGLTNPTLSALVSLYTDDDTQGRALGGFRAAGSLARTVGPLLAALAYFSLGSLAAYSIGAAWLILPFAIALTLPTPQKTEA